MQLLLLGADEATFSLLDTLQQATDQLHVAGWFGSDDVGDRLAQRCPQGNRYRSAEEFAKMVHSEAVVVVGRDGDPAEKEKLLRELARDGIPMILEQPSCSGIFAVELDMIHRDTQAPMIPFHPPAHHPAVSRLANWTRGGESPVGAIEQVVMERSLSDRSDDSVRGALAQDAILLRRLLGNFQRVGAMPAKEIKSLSNLSVQLTGESTAVARWSVGPVNEVGGATLALIGERGRITLVMPEGSAWQLRSTSDALQAETLPPLDDEQHAKSIVQALQGQPISPSWEDAFRATDVADLACESVRRGKTLPVSNQRLTEEDTFKSMMAAGGCLIIMAIPFLLLFVSLFDGLEMSSQRTKIISVAKGQREIELPGDVEAVDFLRLTSESENLPVLPKRQLFIEFGNDTVGRPAAYALSRGAITVAPATDREYDFQLGYEGTFRVWSGWPLLLLSPIALFLMLQLLKLAFPKKID